MTGPVLLLATGDAIAYRQHSGRDEVVDGAALLKLALDAEPRLSTVDVVVEDLSAEPGWDVSTATQLALARRCRDALAEGFGAVVVTGGVDTLAETAYLAGLHADGPLVFTGSSRCLDEPGSEGPGNLVAALLAAGHAPGAVVCSGGELHAARWARLTAEAGFTSAPHGPVGRVRDGRVVPTGVASPPATPRVPEEPAADVALLSVYPDMPATLLTAAADAGARGIVLAGTGAGNVPVELFATIGELLEWDIPVVVTAAVPGRQPCGTGLVYRLGAISARDLPPPQARSALMVALGGGGVAAVREWFSRL
ncbi:asparaginase [Amycolatopsis suaedae]|uniref:Asparaginase n=1 Tax=Amycolatopsis suaedae TaxID=2510978 RepID=A0A4Q7J0Y0_9PSEU|nr:asparaginase domain-containing protein [Amycolatopsis suaedae]RZQ59594.1 asparaginase [Amycolatopsis suaedae]